MSKIARFIFNRNALKSQTSAEKAAQSDNWSALINLLDLSAQEEAVTPGTISAIAALQAALIEIIRFHDEVEGCPVQQVTMSGTENGQPWAVAARKQWMGIDSPEHRDVIMLAAQGANPALTPYAHVLEVPELAGDLEGVLLAASKLDSVPPFTMSLGDLLLAPSRAHPNDLWAQLDWILENWADFLPDALRVLLLRAKDLHKEETLFRGFGGPGPVSTRPFPVGNPSILGGIDDPAIRFSDDQDWMRRLVMVAKHTYVWLDQLSRRYERHIHTLDAVPDEELQQLAEAGVTGIWLIGIWERSRASQEIKRRMGDHDALASAYSIWDYVVSNSLGGPDAADRLAERAWRFGIRIGADMVPNHVSLDGRWVAEHPDRFIQLDAPPFPSYSFNGPNLSHDDRMEVHLEDGYWDQRDAAVVFRHIDRHTGQVRYMYHGNDGTQMPWNDTAQLDYTNPETREAVIQSLLDVARRFPIIRLDAAMTLARKHVQRLWFPPPGSGGAIPSRAEHGLVEEDFAHRAPREFWVEVVERVQQEAPGTLLLAEAFWMMEGYFVKTLGMHRVYHSAFMHMLRDGQNAEFRAILHNILEYGPAILERYANFMSNPDEESAAEQFGREEFYLCVMTLTATLPGLPMIGHGQLEGFKEKYGMEYSRAKWDEPIDTDLKQRHENFVFPLFRERERFSGVKDFHLYDHRRPNGEVNPDVYAFSNLSGDGRRSLVFVHHGGGFAEGGIAHSGLRNEGSIESPHLVSRPLHEAMKLRVAHNVFYGVWELHSRQWRLMRSTDLAAHGFRYSLGGYEIRIFMDFREIEDHDGTWNHLCNLLSGRPVPDLDEEWRRLFEPPPSRRTLPTRPLSPEAAVDGGLAPCIPPRGAGLLLHVGSLPGPEGIGTVGASAHRLLDWMSQAGLRYWQMLPICEGGPGGSPYSSPASLVGSPWLIDLTDLAEQGLLNAAQLESGCTENDGPVDLPEVQATKRPLLRAAAEQLLSNTDLPIHTDWLQWREANPWVRDVALFQSLRHEQGGTPWWIWPAALRDRTETAIRDAEKRLSQDIVVHEVLAFLFDHQWNRLQAAANERGILLFGDLPIYVARDSADVWANRAVFELSETGLPDRVAGVPPDAFSDNGQLWGNPLYNWTTLSANDHKWWVDRLERCLTWTPVLRIDHFRAFAAYWAIPGDAETAIEGQWIDGPGLHIFEQFRTELGGQWLVAEDLGDIDDKVHDLRRKAGLLCTRVLQFAFGSDDENLHLPINCPTDSVMYTGTHDNDTTLGWSRAIPKSELERAAGWMDCEPAQIVKGMIRTALNSHVQVVIFPVQDLLGLGSEARMNIPGKSTGNWSWRMKAGALSTEIANELNELVGNRSQRDD